MKYSLNAVFFLLLVASFLAFGDTAGAQLGLTQADVNVAMVPENPGPNQDVYVTLTSYSLNINSSNITWKIDGKTVLKGVGEKSFNFTTGGAGVTTTLLISVTTFDGQTINNTIRIRPTSVDLVWQSGGFVPPFYKGKSLFAHQDTITFVAMPHLTGSNGSEISPKNLVYKWIVDGVVKDANSGYGKNSYTTTGSLISRALSVEVEVTSPTNNSVGYAKTVVVPTDPLIVFYKKDPLYGIEFQKALVGAEILTSKEIAIIGVPFFYGTGNIYSGLLYKWSINGVPIDSDTTQTTRVFRQNPGVSGTSNIALSIEHATKILQFSSTNLNLVFGNNENQQ